MPSTQTDDDLTAGNASSPDGASRPRVQSAARAVDILLSVSRSDVGLTTREISETVGISRQATYHLLHTLVGAGVLVRNSNNRYVLGLRVGTLVSAFNRQMAPPERLAPIVRGLAQDTGETAYAAGWWSGEVTALTVARGTNPVQAAEVPQGYVGDAHARAAGKLLLANASDEVRETYLASHALRRLTANTIVKRDVLDREFVKVRAQGYAVDAEEFAQGVCCMAVPLDNGYSPFVLSLSVPRERFEESFSNYLAIMHKAAASSLTLGAEPA